MKKQLLGAFVASTFLLPAAAGAQSYDFQRESQPHYQANLQSSNFDRHHNPGSFEGRVSMTITFGPSSNESTTPPRLELTGRAYKKHSDPADWMLSNNFYQESIGFTLGKQPKLLFNGKEPDFEHLKRMAEGSEKLEVSSETVTSVAALAALGILIFVDF